MLSFLVTLHHIKALDILSIPNLTAETQDPFDFIFTWIPLEFLQPRNLAPLAGQLASPKMRLVA